METNKITLRDKMKLKVCPYCKGDGRVRAPVDAGYENIVVCEDCNGKGYVEG